MDYEIWKDWIQNQVFDIPALLTKYLPIPIIVIIIYYIYVIWKFQKQFKTLIDKQYDRQINNHSIKNKQNEQINLDENQIEQVKKIIENQINKQSGQQQYESQFQDLKEQINTINEQQNKTELQYQKLEPKFQLEISQLKDDMKEIQKLKRQLQEETKKQNDQLQEEIRTIKGQFQEEIKKIKGQYQEEIQTQKVQLQEEIRTLKGQFQEETKKQKDQLQEEIRTYQSQFQEEIQILKGQYQEEIQTQKDQFQKELKTLKDYLSDQYILKSKINELFANNQEEIKKINKDIEKLQSQIVDTNEILNSDIRNQIQTLQNNYDNGIQYLTNEVQDLMKIKLFTQKFDDIQGVLQKMQKKIQDMDQEIKNLINKLPPSPPPSPPPEDDTIISALYNKTCRIRNVEPQYRPFVSGVLTQTDLTQEYAMNKLEVKNKLKQHLGGMRKSRGDGNCFYTSFVFQYLDFMINKAKKEQFQELVQLIQMLPFEIKYENEMYNQTDFDKLKQKFIGICQWLRKQNKVDRFNYFFDYFKDEQNEFYGLSIVFLRNLAFKYCSEDSNVISIFSAQGFNLKEQLLQWEFDCQINECIINSLSQNLNIHTIQFNFDQNQQNLIILEYNENSNALLRIYLLFRPGHYNIGIPNVI